MTLREMRAFVSSVRWRLRGAWRAAMEEMDGWYADCRRAAYETTDEYKAWETRMVQECEARRAADATFQAYRRERLHETAASLSRAGATNDEVRAILRATGEKLERERGR